MINYSIAKISSILFILTILSIYLPSYSFVHASLTSSADTMSNPRASFISKPSGSFSSGVNTISIGTTSTYPDRDLNNLFTQDGICIVDSGLTTCTAYTVASIASHAGQSLTLTSGLSAGITTANFVMTRQTSTHTVTFTTGSSVVNPILEVRIPAMGQTAASKDTFPDSNTNATASGFDLNGLVAGDITCSGGAPSWVASVVDSTASGGNYHVVKCTGTGTLAASAAITITIGATNKLLNPSVSSTHTRGTADNYNIVIRELDSGSSLVDSQTVTVFPNDGVEVSATVNSSLSFAVAGVASSTSKCGNAQTVTSTATTVPFGTLASTATPYYAAQTLTISTNSANGYSVTSLENGPLYLDGISSNASLANTTCPSNTCTSSTAADWTVTTASGFGYALSGTDVPSTLAYNYSSRTFNARPFDASVARQIMTNAGPVSGSTADVCYRIVAGATQAPGTYFNKITYVATPTF